MLTQVGKYQIIEKVGVGGFGSVYKGRDPFIKRLVAIKTCQSDEEELKKRFFREAEFAGNLHHRNITTIYDFGVTDEGVPYIVQEFLTGEDLDKRIKRKDKTPLARKVQILIDVCEGLAYAHAAGIIHRDIKPSNVRILEDGTVKLMDFGIAKSMVSQSTLTQTGITLGTASYLAPEQIRGDPIDPRTDIFSLGVLGYELLTSQKPFAGDHISTVLYKILNEMPERPRSMDPDVPEALDALVMRALEKDRTNRYASCAQLLEELKAIADTLSGTQRVEPASTPMMGPSENEPTIVTPTGGLPSQRPSVNASGTGPARSARLESTSLGAPPRIAMTGSVGDVRIRHEDTVVSAPTFTQPDEGGGALKIFILSLLTVVVLGGGAFYFLTIRPGAVRKAGGDVPVPTPAPATAASTTTSPPPPAVPTAIPTTAPTAAKAAEAAPGSAKLSSNYFAELTVDGVRRKGGTQPPMTLTGLKPGTHKAVFQAEGLAPVERTFEVRSGETASVSAEFPARGLLEVQVNYQASNAEIFLDGSFIGRAPLKRRFVKTGTHELQGVLAGFETASKTIEVNEYDVTKVQLVLKPAASSPEAPK